MENINRTLLSFGKNYQGVLKMIGAVAAFLLTLGTLINLINISGFMGLSSYPDFAEIIYSFCQIMAILCAVAGFCTLGIMLLVKPQHVLVPAALAVLALSALFGAAEDLFYYIWQTSAVYSFYFSYPYLFMAFIASLTAVAWAFPAVAGFVKDKTMFRNILLILLIIPAALFLIYFFAAAFTGVLYFSAFLYQLLKYALMAIAALVILCADGKSAMESMAERNQKNTEQRWQGAQSTQPGQTAHASYQQQQNQPGQQPRPAATIQPEGYISILKLIILSIVTLGIYIYIWIYKTSKYLDGVLNRQGSFSPGWKWFSACLFPSISSIGFTNRAKRWTKPTSSAAISATMIWPSSTFFLPFSASASSPMP